MKLPSAIKSLAHRIFNRTIRLAPRSALPYASHLPVLVGMGIAAHPRSIVEYGSGLFSTCAFLEREAFPDLARVKSFENDLSWHREMCGRVAGDPRAQIEFVSGPISEAIDIAELKRADLIFIDDSTGLERARTIRAVAATRLSGIPVVIHDVDIWRCRCAARSFDRQFFFNAANPQTGVVWNGNWPQHVHLKAIDRIIRQYCAQLSHAHVSEWRQVFLRAMGHELRGVELESTAR